MADDYQGGYAALSVVVKREMAERDMSIRQFAEFTGIGPTTAHGMIHGTPGNPSLDVLIKLSEAIKVNLCTLLGITFPHVKVMPSPRLAYLLERIEVLSDAERESINLIVDVLLQNPVVSDEVKALLRLLLGQ